MTRQSGHGRSRLLYSLAVILVCCCSEVGAAEDAWVVKAEMPTTRGGVHAAVVGQTIYVIGGCDFSTGASAEKCVLATVEAYDTQTDRWSKKASMVVPRVFLATAAVDGKIYAIGGSSQAMPSASALSVVEVYDPQTDRWLRKADLPAPVADATASVVGGKIYLIGGTRHVGVDALATAYVYDPSSDVWSSVAAMPTPRLHLCSAVSDDKIYVLGGSTAEWPAPSAHVEVYDPAANRWKKIADMPTERSGLWCSAAGGKIYAFGGVDWDAEALSTVEEYDPVNDSWLPRANMPTPRLLLTTASANGKIYALGGWSSSYVSLNATEEYTP